MMLIRESEDLATPRLLPQEPKTGNVEKRGTLPLGVQAHLPHPRREAGTEEPQVGTSTRLQKKPNLRAEIKEASDTPHQSWTESLHLPLLAEEETDQVTERKMRHLCLRGGKEGMTCHRSNRRLLDLHRNVLHHDSTRTHNAHALPAPDEERGDHRLHETHPLSEGTAAGSASESERETDLGQGQWTETKNVPERGEQGAADLGAPEDQVLFTG